MLLLTAAGFAGVDLVAKALAEARLGDASIELGVLQLRLLYNEGVAFGLGDALPAWVVAAFTAAVTVAMTVYGWRHAPGAGWVQRLAGGAVIGGAAANVIDRLPDSVVTDYLHTGWWPTFNLADTFLVVGLLVFTLTTFREQAPRETPPLPPRDPDSGKPADEPRLLNPW